MHCLRNDVASFERPAPAGPALRSSGAGASSPARIGIDARMLSAAPTGVGNYISAMLVPMCAAHPKAQFFLYSNSRVGAPALDNVTVREGGARIGPWWMNVDLPGQLRRDRIDVFWGANGVAPVALNLPPTVVTVHDLVYRFAGQTMGRGARWTKRVFQGWSVRRAAQVTAVSNATASDVAAVYGRNVDAVIGPVADPAFQRRDAAAVRDVRARHGLPDRFWFFAGTLEPRKNLVQMLQAYLRARADGLELPTLALAGASGWGEAPLNRLIERGEASGSVRRLGYLPVDELACLYCACEVLWMPSLYEGFGLPLLEAQRCGAPVVHGPHASMAEAAAGLGVTTGTDAESLRQMMRAIVTGEAPLACRIEPVAANERTLAAERLWACFDAAARRRQSR
jgi:glycosyltransferase involved in cell wall biosynthesis